MRLLIDAHLFDDYYQGTRTYLKGLYSELLKIDQETEFYFTAYNTKNLESIFGLHKNVTFVALGSHNKYKRLLYEIPSIIKNYEIDMAHFQYISPPIKNCRQIVTTHDILFKDFKEYFPLKYRILNDFLFRRSAKKADLLLTVSEYSRQAISKHYQIAEEDIFVTPNAISDTYLTETKDIDIKEKYGLKKILLYVGRVEPRKNHHLILQAFNEMKLWQNDYQLVFIGSKSIAYEELDKNLASLESVARSNVFFLEGISNEELKAFYGQCEVFIFPSLAEGFGIPPLEAACCGTQVLCSNQTAMAEFSFFGDWLFDPTDIDELKNKLQLMLEGKGKSIDLEGLKNKIQERYSWKNSAAIFKNLLYK